MGLGTGKKEMHRQTERDMERGREMVCPLKRIFKMQKNKLLHLAN
jgi:hypothetical protein